MGKGWHNEYERHVLAGLGIKSGRKNYSTFISFMNKDKKILAKYKTAKTDAQKDAILTKHRKLVNYTDYKIKSDNWFDKAKKSNNFEEIQKMRDNDLHLINELKEMDEAMDEADRRKKGFRELLKEKGISPERKKMLNKAIKSVKVKPIRAFGKIEGFKVVGM